MDQEEPTLKSFAHEVATPGYRARARVRSRASKTGWDLLFMPIGFGLIGAYWFAFASGAMWLHALTHAGEAALAPGHGMTLAEGLMGLPPLLAAVPLGFLTSNSLMSLVPAARRAHAAKMQQPGWVSFRGAQRGLFKIAQVLVPIGLAPALIGALL
jgi:hypothetical protein